MAKPPLPVRSATTPERPSVEENSHSTDLPRRNLRITRASCIFNRSRSFSRFLSAGTFTKAPQEISNSDDNVHSPQQIEGALSMRSVYFLPIWYLLNHWSSALDETKLASLVTVRKPVPMPEGGPVDLTDACGKYMNEYKVDLRALQSWENPRDKPMLRNMLRKLDLSSRILIRNNNENKDWILSGTNFNISQKISQRRLRKIYFCNPAKHHTFRSSAVYVYLSNLKRAT